jgi:hypothetical protein
METPLAEVTRLFGALEQLVAEERVLLHHHDGEAILAQQRRIQPLMRRIVELAPQVPPAQWPSARAERFIELRHTNASRLALRKSQIKAQLRLVGEARQRLAKIRPVYGFRSRSSGARSFAAVA